MAVAIMVSIPVSVFVEVEQVEEIANCRAVGWHVGIACPLDRIRQIISASAGQWLQVPVPFDELHDGSMVIVGMVDMATFGEG